MVLAQLQGIQVQNPRGCCIPGSSSRQAGVPLPGSFPGWAARRELPGGKAGFYLSEQLGRNGKRLVKGTGRCGAHGS